jgi:hypothetical protein
MAVFPINNVAVFPTVNNVGGDDRNIYTEKHVTELISNALVRDCVTEIYITRNASTMEYNELTVFGVFIIEGHLVRTAASQLIEIDPEVEVSYIYVSLVKDGIGNVTGAEITVSESDSLSNKLCIGKAWWEDYPTSTIIDFTHFWISQSPLYEGVSIGHGAPRLTAARKFGNDFFIDNGSDKIYTEITAPYLKNIEPSNTEIYKNTSSFAVEAETDVELLSLIVPKGGRYRIKFTLANSDGTGDLTISSALTGLSVTASIDAYATSLTVDGPYMIAGDTLTISAKVGDDDKPRTITSIALCGTVITPPNNVTVV